MTNRINSTSRLLSTLSKAVYRAFAEPGAMELRIPPGKMRGMNPILENFAIFVDTEI